MSEGTTAEIGEESTTILARDEEMNVVCERVSGEGEEDLRRTSINN